MESFGFSRQTNRLVKNFLGKIKRERDLQWSKMRVSREDEELEDS